MRELLRAVFDGKPLIALVETEMRKGGLTLEQSREGLVNVITRLRENWGTANLSTEMVEWGFEPPPNASLLYAALFASEPIEWNRIGVCGRIGLSTRRAPVHGSHMPWPCVWSQASFKT
jgi:hypothetical protein